MRVVFVDESIDFDGSGPASRPLDGPQKALANLATSLAMRGHDVTVFNRCTTPATLHAVRWEPLNGVHPAAADLLVALRQPALLEFVADAKRRVLWLCGLSGPADAAARESLERHRPLVVAMSRAQREAWSNPLALDTVVIEPGIAPAYFEEAPVAPAEPARALSTAHPLAGVADLIKLWVERIRPEVPQAELHVYSALLDLGRAGGTVAKDVAVVLAQALAAAPQGVVLQRPQADPGMAEAYRGARVHLHPAAASDICGFTLAESQAMGLPGVVLARNPVVVERIADGQTGMIAASDAAFASAAITLLTDRLSFDRMSAAARSLKRGRSWAVAAAEWEERFA